MRQAIRLTHIRPCLLQHVLSGLWGVGRPPTNFPHLENSSRSACCCPVGWWLDPPPPGPPHRNKDLH